MIMNKLSMEEHINVIKCKIVLIENIIFVIFLELFFSNNFSSESFSKYKKKDFNK